MTDRLDFETRLEERLRARAALASRPFDAAAIARETVAVNGRRRRLGGLEWPSTRPALGWLVMALLLAIALLGAIAGVGALLRGPSPMPAELMTVIRQQADAINARDAEVFADSFAPDAVFDPGGVFAENRSLFPRSERVAESARVRAWMAIQEAWGLEAEVISCYEIIRAEARRFADGPGPALHVECEVGTRWHTLSLEVRQTWQYEFHDGLLLAWSHGTHGFSDLNPRSRDLPLGYDGLESWEAWLQENDPASAARYLNPREGSCTESARDAINGCREGQDSLAPGDPVFAAKLARVLSGTERSWSINGLDFHPIGFIPYDPALAAEIEASIQMYLDSSISDPLEKRP